MAIYPKHPNSELYILKDIPLNNVDKVNFYGKTKQFQISYFLGAEYAAPTSEDFSTKDYLNKYPNVVYCGFKYSVVKDKYIDIPININDVQSGNYLIYRNNIPPYATGISSAEMNVDTSRVDAYNNIGTETKSIGYYYDTDFMYCFITDIEFLNANTTRVYIEKDIFTTYSRYIGYKECMIEREHTTNSPFYYDYVQENFSFDTDVKSFQITQFGSLSYFYAVILSESDLSYRLVPKEDTATGSEPFELSFETAPTCAFNGIDTGLYAYCFPAASVSKIRQLIKNASMIGQAGEIKKIIYIPINGTTVDAFVGSVATNADVMNNYAYYEGYKAYYLTQESGTARGNFDKRVKYTTCSNITTEVVDTSVTFTLPPSDSTIRNNKTYSYMKLTVVGDKEVEIPIHLLTSTSVPFEVATSNILPTVNIVCSLKKGDGSSLFANKQCFATSLSLFNCGGTYDNMLNTMSAESQKIQNARATQSAETLSSLASSVAMATINPGTAPMAIASFMGTAIGSGVSTDAKISNILEGAGRDQRASIVDMSAMDKYSIGVNGFYLKQTYPTHTYMKIIDDYFSAFGYKTQRYGLPKYVNSGSGLRATWNYIQTVNCNYNLNRPLKEVNALRSDFNNGLRMWTPKAYTDFKNKNIGFGDTVKVNSLNSEV